MSNEMIEPWEPFWSHVDIIHSSLCWLWKGTKQSNGKGMFYGYVKYKGKWQRVNRLIWKLHNKKEIPDDMVIRHTCDVSLCCNPAHLILGTQKQNVEDTYDRCRDNNLFGSAHGMSKLTEKDILEIRKLLKNGLSQRKVANQFNVSQNQIKEISLGRAWRHV